jgi:hypothetical protein
MRFDGICEAQQQVPPTKIFRLSQGWLLRSSGFAAGSRKPGPLARDVAMSSSILVGKTNPPDAFYDDERAFKPFPSGRQQPGSLVPARTLDLGAFWLVVNLLAGITALVPIA